MEARNCNPTIVAETHRSLILSEALETRDGWGTNRQFDGALNRLCRLGNDAQYDLFLSEQLPVNSVCLKSAYQYGIPSNAEWSWPLTSYSNSRERTAFRVSNESLKPHRHEIPNARVEVERRAAAIRLVSAITVSTMALTIQEVFGVNMAQLARIIGVSRPTLYNHLRSDSAPVEKYLELYKVCEQLKSEGICDLGKGLKSILLEGNTLLDKLKEDPVDYSSLVRSAQVCHELLNRQDLDMKLPSKVDDSSSGLAAISKSI